MCILPNPLSWRIGIEFWNEMELIELEWIGPD